MMLHMLVLPKTDLANDRLGLVGLGLSRSSRLTSIMSTKKDMLE